MLEREREIAYLRPNAEFNGLAACSVVCYSFSRSLGCDIGGDLSDDFRFDT